MRLSPEFGVDQIRAKRMARAKSRIACGPLAMLWTLHMAQGYGAGDVASSERRGFPGLKQKAPRKGGFASSCDASTRCSANRNELAASSQQTKSVQMR